MRRRPENFVAVRSNRVHSVPHAAQLVRRECYETIGGYAVLPYGGEDWYAQTCAKMNGWEIEAIPELPIFHHRHTGAEGESAASAVSLWEGWIILLAAIRSSRFSSASGDLGKGHYSWAVW